MGVLPTEEALQRAQEANQDLVEVSPNADPPVCKIMDFGKHLYQQRKREHEAKKKQVTFQIKEVRLRPKTDTHDRSIKMDRAKRFLSQGCRVQLNMLFRGRELAHKDLGRERLMEFAEELDEIAKIETMPQFSNRRMTMLLAPRSNITDAQRKQKRESADKRKGDKSERSKAVTEEEAAAEATAEE